MHSFILVTSASPRHWAILLILNHLMSTLWQLVILQQYSSIMTQWNTDKQTFHIKIKENCVRENSKRPQSGNAWQQQSKKRQKSENALTCGRRHLLQNTVATNVASSHGRHLEGLKWLRSDGAAAIIWELQHDNRLEEPFLVNHFLWLHLILLGWNSNSIKARVTHTVNCSS